MMKILLKILCGLPAVLATVLSLTAVVVALTETSQIGKAIFWGLAGAVATIGVITALPALILSLKTRYLGAATGLALAFYGAIIVFWLKA